MGKLKQTYANAKRAGEIIAVFAKYGLGYIFDAAAVSRFFALAPNIFNRRPEEKIKKLSPAARLRLALSELGPTFIKFGQILSVRPDLISPALAQELAKLQDEAPPFSFKEVAVQIKNELGKDIKELFADFDPQPIAAASLSQVHKAKLLSGEVVAVKIQRPNIEQIIKNDLNILYDLARFVEKRWRAASLYQPKEIVKEIKRIISQELNFAVEGRAMDTFNQNFAENDYILAPRVFWDLSAEKVLTMEYIDGIKMSAVMAGTNDRFNKKLLASRGADAILQQIFIDGFFHGDPHPGNIMVLDDDRLVFLDFGMMGKLDEEVKNLLANIFLAVLSTDAERIIKNWQELGMLDIKVNVNNLKNDLRYFLDKYYTLPLREIKIGEVMEELFGLMRQYQIKVPPNLILLAKAMVTMEGIGRELDPDFNLASRAKSFASRILKEKYAPQRLIKRGANTLEEIIGFLEKMPAELSWLVKYLKAGELTIGLKHKELERLNQAIDRASNRLTFGIITAALIVGSSLVIQSNRGPFIHGYPILGIVGFITAGLLGVGLIISLIKRGKL